MVGIQICWPLIFYFYSDIHNIPITYHKEKLKKYQHSLIACKAEPPEVSRQFYKFKWKLTPDTSQDNQNLKNQNEC